MKRKRLKEISSLILIFTLAGGFFTLPPRAFAVTCDNSGTITNFVASGSDCIGFITTTGSGTFTLPSNWTSTNVIEVIGGGAGGQTGAGSGGSSNQGGGGGGGGAYSKSTNVTVANGASFSVGTGGGSATNGSDTWFNASACDSSSICAKGGLSGTFPTGGAGGQAASGFGVTKNNGGSGGNGQAVKVTNGGGGGGAAGCGAAACVSGSPGADGNAGHDSSGSDSAGGQGDGTFGGTGGAAGAPGGTGNPGAEWAAISVGAGGGGGGANANANAGGPGGSYGAGGGGGRSASGAGGSGIQGIIIITYTPAAVAPPTVTTSFANPGATTASLYGTKTGGEDATQHGFAWGTNANLSNGDTATTTLGALNSNSSFASGISGLSTGATYFFRAYATNDGGTGYGIIRSFVTGSANVTRNMRLFEGFTVKLFNGRVILYQQ